MPNIRHSRYKLFFIFILAFFAINAFSQSSLKIANSLFKSEKYCDAIKYYNKYLKEFADESAYYKRGICNYHCMYFKHAINDFENTLAMGNDDDEINLYLAKTYHHHQKFEKAIVFYKKYLGTLTKNNEERREILYQIKRSANAIKLKYKPTNHFIENWGPKINTPFNDILPVQSPSDIHHFYFSSDRVYGLKKSKQFKEFQVDFSDGEWEKLFDIFSSENNKNTIFLDFYDGNDKIAYFLGPSQDIGSIFVSNYSHAAKQLSTSDKLEAPINAEYGFRHLQFINDSTIVFSSNKEGGYGGYDLYFTGIRNGQWFEPINLGDKINTSFDEISPFITKNGENLFFSSNNLNSIGGFDVFKSEFSFADDDWSKPENLGLPISSSADEIGFRVLTSGKGGVFNSNRKDKGFGGHDLYWIYFKKLIDVKRAYALEIPYLRNRHLKLIKSFEIEPEDIVVAENTQPEDNENDLKVPIEKETAIKKEPQQEQKKEEDKKDTSKTIKKQTNKSKNTEIAKDKPLQKPESTTTKPIKKKDKKDKSKIVKKKVIKSKRKKENFIIPLLFIKENKFRDKETLVDFIDRLSNLMKKNPDVVVEFVGNAFEWQSNKSDILNSVRNTESLADSLILRMIEPERIIIKGVGSSLPAAKPYGPKRSKNIITKANNRIDVFIHNKKELPVNIKTEGLYISRSIEDSRYKLYRTVIKGLTYKLQVKEGDFLFLNKLLENYNDSSIEKDIVNNKYYYTIGLYKEYISVKELFKKILALGHRNIKIIPYIDGIRIEEKDILSQAKKHLDLINYLEDNKNK